MTSAPIRMSDDEKAKLCDESLTAEPISVLGRKYHLKSVLSTEGMKSVVWKGTDDFDGTLVAVKFATKRDYFETVYLAEITIATKLNEYPHFTKYLGAAEQIINGVECVVFIEQFVTGTTLAKFNGVTPSFLESYIREFCVILNILKENKLRHDDLNYNNVMIVPPLPGDFRDHFSLKIIDMGSLKNMGDALKPSKHGFNDLRRFCLHLTFLSNRILYDNEGNRKALSKKERGYRQVIKDVVPLILEEDENAALNDPEKIQEVFASKFSKILKNPKETISVIETPFDFISADHIGSDVLLNSLFATSCPWLEDVRNNTPVLLTGPRGCGKSMIFRWLSFKSMLAKGDLEILNSSSIIGFYVSCSSDLRNRFSLYDTPLKTAQAKEEIIHYFNLITTREIAFTLSLMCQYPNSEDIFGLSKHVEIEVYNFIVNALNLEKSKTYLQGSKPFDHLYDIILREMNQCYRYMLKREKAPNATSLTYLSDLTLYLKTKIDFFKSRTITFLLDDYSKHRIDESVQMILNPILWERQANHIFKVSSEKFGMVSIQGNESNAYSMTSDLGREFIEIDVGERYVSLGDSGEINQLTKFCTELLDHRLSLANYDGITEGLIGNSNYGVHRTLEHALRFQSKEEKKDYDEYHGIETISKICSGDIAALLEMYRRIFKEGNINKTSVSTISKSKQNKAIQSTSRAFLEIIKTFNFGLDMYDLVNSFGNLSRKILQEGKLQKDGTINVTTRIEVDELEDVEKWKPEQKDLFFELIHRSIFISLEQGRGRRTLGSTLRIQLRRIYCPHFKTGLTKTVAIKLNTAEFRYFLSDPITFCTIDFDKRWAISKSSEKTTEIETAPQTKLDLK